MGSLSRSIARNAAKNMLNGSKRGRKILDKQKETQRKDRKAGNGFFGFGGIKL
jgi:hypothetical protein